MRSSLSPERAEKAIERRRRTKCVGPHFLVDDGCATALPPLSESTTVAREGLSGPLMAPTVEEPEDG